MRRIDLHVREGAAFDTALRAVKQADPIDYTVILPEQRDRRILQVFVRDATSQSLVDALQAVLETERDWRLNVVPIEATLPDIEPARGEKEARNTQAIREEILADVKAGAMLDRDFLIFVVFSTLVAAISMNSGSVAGVIGAMVIAPLLGPILGFAMGSALGNSDLIWASGKTLAAGIVLAVALSVGLSQLVAVDLQAHELVSRAEVRLDGLVLALAAGGAAAMGLTKGQSGALVGVMVAAALLPPGVAVGLFLGAGAFDLGGRAALLLTLNVAALILAALLTFRLRKIRPRTWIEQQHARRAAWIVRA